MSRLTTLSTLLIVCLNIGINTQTFAQPVNDDPCGAIELSPINGPVCTPAVPMSWVDATASANVPPPGCGLYSTGDVWFKFNLTDASDIFISTTAGNGGGGITDGVMALYFADTCDGTLTLLKCDDDGGVGSMPQINLPAQAAGLYLIRFWDYHKKTTANFGGICLATQTVVSNAPNDDPCNALELIPINDFECTPNNPQNWIGATSTAITPPNCGSYLTGDVWFKFSLTDTSDVVISTLAGQGLDAITDGAMALYHADSCNGTWTLMLCNSNNTPDLMPKIQASALLPNTYYIRFWDSQDKTTGNFGGICVATQKSIVVPTLNDEPCGAIALTVELSDECTPQNPLTWSMASASPNLPNPSCGSYTTGDIWFKFTLDQVSEVFITTVAGSGPGTITDGAMSLYKADSCAMGFIQVSCNDDGGPGNMPQITEFSLAVGTYYIRFWDYNDQVSGNIDGICVAATPLQIVVPNDNCTEAIPIPAIPTDGTCAEILVNTIGATGALSNSCGATTEDDVWYTFVMPDNAQRLAFSMQENGNPTQQGLRIYSGNCGQLVSVHCFNQPEGLIANLVAGQTYIIRTYTTADAGGAEYSICLSVPPAPVNDDPCGAIELTVVEDLECTPDIPQSWSLASASPGISAPGCANYATGDVWFKFFLDFKADFTIKTKKGFGPTAIDDGGMALYFANSCDQLTQISCNDDQSEQNFMPEISAEAMPAGEYYIRFWDYQQKISGHIGGICVAAIPSQSVLENDICLGALAFPPIPLDGSCATLNINTELAIGGGGPPVTGFPDDDLWYSFEVPNGVKSLVFEVKTNSGNNQQMLCVYDSCSMQTAPRYFYNLKNGLINDLIPGKTYWLRVYTYEQNVASDFDVCLKLPPPPPVNDLCDNPLPFPTIPDDGSCASVTVDFKWASNTRLGCNNFEMGDVWFEFTVPNNTTSLIASFEKTEGNYLHSAFEVLSGTCNALTSVDCFFDGSFNSLTIKYLVPGQTYLLRAYALNNIQAGYYDLCLRVPSSPTPINDECAGALPYPAIPTDGTAVTMEVNTLGATGDNSNACWGIYDDDVWLSFVMPQGHTSLLATRRILSGTPFEALGLYGGSCDNLELISCHIQRDTLFTGLVGGETYYIRAYSYFANDTAHYEIALRVLPVLSQPHDECPGALAFPNIPLDGSWSSVWGSTMGATASGLPACNGSADDDVWYSFNVPQGYDRLLFNADVENAFNNYGFILELFEGDCNGLNFLGCYDVGESSHLSGLVGGNTYFLRVYSSSENDIFHFKIDLAVPKPLLNDLCENAIAFPTLPKDGTCIELLGNTALATGNGDLLCGGTANDDVWYKFNAPDDRTAIHFEFRERFGSSGTIAFYSGQCDNLNLVECFQFSGLDDVSNLIPSKTYYIRVFSRFANPNASVDFRLCLSAAPLPQDNDDCIQASSITSAPGVFADPGLQTLGGATLSDEPMCAQYAHQQLPYDVWYSFVTDEDGGDAQITLQELIEMNTDFSWFEAAWEVFSGDCDDLSTVWCGRAADADLNQAIHLEGLEGNTRYYFRVFGMTTTGGYGAQDFLISVEGSAFSPTISTETPLEVPESDALHLSKIYPSPATTQITLQYHAPKSGQTQLLIADLLGRIVSTRNLQSLAGENRERIELGQLPPGMYTVLLQNETQKSAALRFVKVE
jgi:hypothetical protein